MSNHGRRPGPEEAAGKSRTAIIKLKSWFARVSGSPVETDLSPYRDLIEKIKRHDLRKAPGGRLRQLSRELARRGRSGTPLLSLEVEVFALVREASRRAVGLDPFDVQMIAGLAIGRKKIAELPTGEGKTLAAVFPACLWAMSGLGVHVLTFNDYLARRDAAWMGPIYESLGLSLGCIQEGMDIKERRAAYACDVTYATAKEAGFDFLRDRIAVRAEDLVHRPLAAAIVDEADSILIDEARIPLVISGLDDRPAWDAGGLSRLVKSLTPGLDYATDAEHRNVFPTDAGVERLESGLGCGSLYDPANLPLVGAIHCALHAEALLRRDVDYIVRSGKIEIVDEFTGRVVDNRHWPDGLQAAVEAKENLSGKSEGRILGSITLQHFFGLYRRLSGMTATARPSARELKEFYGLGVVVVPPNRRSLRVDHPDVVFTHGEAKRLALVKEILDAHASGRPVLAGTASVRESEELAADLRRAGASCRVLNARNDELEAGIIAQAGRPGAVTISTNMAGRGTDIKLGGPDERERGRVVESGGLYVIGTNRHESLRIDLQLRGRAGRQGDPGSTRFFISLEDELFERYGLSRMFFDRHHLQPQPGAIESRPLRREIDHAQRIIEGQNFDIRKTLSKYSSLVEFQRKIVQERRDRVLVAGEPPGIFPERRPDLSAAGEARFGRTALDELERRVFLAQVDRRWSEHLAWITDTRESIHLVSLAGQAPIHEFQKSATAAFIDLQNGIEEGVIDVMESMIRKDGPVDLEAEARQGPSSTWTYLVNEDQFGWGIEMLSGKNIGLAAGAAALYHGPLFVLALLLNKIFRRKKRELS